MAEHQYAPVVVTQHPALVLLLRERGLIGEDVEVITHVTSADQIAGRHVIGVLPLHLAAKAASITSVPLTLSAEEREQRTELTLERLREVAGSAEMFVVRTGEAFSLAALAVDRIARARGCRDLYPEILLAFGLDSTPLVPLEPIDTWEPAWPQFRA